MFEEYAPRLRLTARGRFTGCTGASRGDPMEPKSELARWLLGHGWGWCKRDDEEAVVVEVQNHVFETFEVFS